MTREERDEQLSINYQERSFLAAELERACEEMDALLAITPEDVSDEG